MKLLRIFILSFALLNANDLSKQDLLNFLSKVIEPKLNTKNFTLIIEKNDISPDYILSDENIDDISIPPQQRSFQVNLKFKNGEKVTISGKIEWMTNIPILLRAIGPTEIINSSDIMTQSYPVDQLSAMVVMDSTDLIGKSSIHTIIKPGLPVERSMLKNPTIIKRGDIVDVVYRSQNLTVSAKAQSTQELANGDVGTFEIHNNNSNGTARRISAKVVGPSSAEIVHGNA